MVEIVGATARDLRRVLGDEAKEIIENQSAMIHAMAQVCAGLVNDIVLCQRKLEALEQRMAKLDGPGNELQNQLANQKLATDKVRWDFELATAALESVVLQRGFWARLKWLVTGR